MKPGYFAVAGWVCTAVAGIALTGCGNSSSDPRNAAGEGTRYLLDEEPSDARGVIETREVVQQAGEPVEATIVGRIGGLSQPTWDPERASFMISDLSLEADDNADHDGAPKHDADNCPFCRVKRKKQAAGLAMVEILDPRGEVPSTGARELLGLADGQTIVLRGRVELNSLGNLVAQTSGIYIKP